jgi:hypothetical protein
MKKELDALKKDMEKLRREGHTWSNDWNWQVYNSVGPRGPRPSSTNPPTKDDIIKQMDELMKTIDPNWKPSTPELPERLSKTDDDLYKIGYMDGKMNEPEDERFKSDESYQMGYNDGKGDGE